MSENAKVFNPRGCENCGKQYPPSRGKSSGKAQIGVTPILKQISTEQPVLIAGPTASGKSALALELAVHQNRAIVNADALQVFSDWQILTARPGAEEMAIAPHHLYGHIPGDRAYSAGEWLREVRPFLPMKPAPIIVGGTGLNFSVLTEGLADIPPTPPEIRAEADTRLAKDGPASLLKDLDAATIARIDIQNPARVQRAWEVQRTTGLGLIAWHEKTPNPDLRLSDTFPILLDADRDWLNERIARRFDLMLSLGALEEARRNEPGWSPDLPSAKAIGAAELIAHLRGVVSLAEAREAACISTRQYAKRQRTWFRSKMKDWNVLDLPSR